MKILEDLKKRGLVQQITDETALAEHLTNHKITLYCGFDPTADSLHIGHLLPITILKRFQKAGHRPIALIGGGTGMIGDPSGRTSERSLNDEEVVHHYAGAIRNQLANLLHFDDDGKSATARNNYDWLANLSFIEFLRDVGKHFTVNYMLAKESVSSRIEHGISYTEFSYMLMQSYDYYKLFEEENCTLQIGGSDQWGNITAGMEFIRRSHNDETVKVFGLTVPLITKADGTKFGKTAGGAVWLDPEKTSPYEFYQFWYNTDDRDVIKFLKYFTFLDLDEIASLEEAVKENPGAREAQRRLAEEVTTMVHGREALEQAIRISKALFSGDIKSLTSKEIEQGLKDVPNYVVEKSDIPLVDLLVDAKISSSRRQAREDITNGAIYINGDRNQKIDHVVTEADRLEDTFTVIRRGRRRYFLIHFK